MCVHYEIPPTLTHICVNDSVNQAYICRTFANDLEEKRSFSEIQAF